MLWRIELGGFIQKICRWRNHHKPMRKSWRHPQLAVVFFRQFHADPAAKSWRFAPDVYHHIQHCATNSTHQLALRLLYLKMQPPQHPFGASAVVVLNKLVLKSGCFFKSFFVVAFVEKAPCITKHFRLKNQYIGNVSWRYPHLDNSSFNTRSMY